MTTQPDRSMPPIHVRFNPAYRQVPPQPKSQSRSIHRIYHTYLTRSCVTEHMSGPAHSSSSNLEGTKTMCHPVGAWTHLPHSIHTSVTFTPARHPRYSRLDLLVTSPMYLRISIALRTFLVSIVSTTMHSRLTYPPLHSGRHEPLLRYTHYSECISNRTSSPTDSHRIKVLSSLATTSKPTYLACVGTDYTHPPCNVECSRTYVSVVFYPGTHIAPAPLFPLDPCSPVTYIGPPLARL